ncbi:MAG: hypothetical protein J07HX5_01130 [halophilic archaeon J07HX5]|jgi:hypothetical protein|nr:MAG: hypothetical protein J07HX5_01130 [halophilic archaeon J07HX5]
MSDPLPPAHADAVSTLATALTDLTEPWALTGSTSFALQGIPVEPTDIDLQTTEAGARAVEARWNEAVTDPVSYVESDQVRSYFGAISLCGVAVEVMGALQKRDADGRWTEPPAIGELRQRVTVAGTSVPVLPLAYEANAYEQLGRTSRAALLRTHAHQRSE